MEEVGIPLLFFKKPFIVEVIKPMQSITMTKQTSLIRKVKNFMMDHAMIQTESHILVALSGGADSVCLLCLLKELEQEMGIKLSALHVHHGIRGTEADSDAAFCQELCAQLKIPCPSHRRFSSPKIFCRCSSKA